MQTASKAACARASCKLKKWRAFNWAEAAFPASSTGSTTAVTVAPATKWAKLRPCTRPALPPPTTQIRTGSIQGLPLSALLSTPVETRKGWPLRSGRCRIPRIYDFVMILQPVFLKLSSGLGPPSSAASPHCLARAPTACHCGNRPRPPSVGKFGWKYQCIPCYLLLYIEYATALEGYAL